MADSPKPGDFGDFEQFADAIAAGFAKMGKFTFLTVDPLKFVAEAIALVISVPLKLMTAAAVFAAQVVVDTLELDNPELNQLTGIVVGEIFGEEVSGKGARGHEGTLTAQDIGKSILNAILESGGVGDGTGINPSSAPAEKFLGSLLGVGVRGWALETIIELGSLGHLKPFHHLTESVTRSGGFGRLARQALGPAVHAAIATPLLWQVNDDLRPTLLPTSAAIKAYNAGRWSFTKLTDEMAAQGYSDDRIDQLMADAEPRVGASDVMVLVRNAVWTEDQAVRYLMDGGLPEPVARAQLQVDNLRQVDALKGRAITAYEVQYKRGLMDDNGFTNALRIINVPRPVAEMWLAILKIEQVAGFKVLDKSQLDAALGKNVISLPEWRAGLTLLGYDEDQITILELTEQAALASKEEAARKKEQLAAQKAADKLAADQARKDAAAAKAAASAKAKADAQAKKDAQAKQHAADLLAKQALLVQQADARRAAIAAAQHAKQISADQAAQALAEVAAQQAAALEAVRAHDQLQTALDQQQTTVDAHAAQLQQAADQAQADTAAAQEVAANQTAALQERRQERLESLAAALDTVDAEEAAGTITAKAAANKRDALNNANDLAVKQERLDQLAIARAVAAAKKTETKAAAALAKAESSASLASSAAGRKTAQTAAAASELAAAKAQAKTATAAAHAQIAAERAANTAKATAALNDALAALDQQRLDFQKKHPGV